MAVEDVRIENKICMKQGQLWMMAYDQLNKYILVQK